MVLFNSMAMDHLSDKAKQIFNIEIKYALKVQTT